MRRVRATTRRVRKTPVAAVAGARGRPSGLGVVAVDAEWVLFAMLQLVLQSVCLSDEGLSRIEISYYADS